MHTSKSSKSKIIALLPMKEHSERVPNKNMRIFADKPLFHHVATILESSDAIHTILINTDSETIALDAINHFSKVRIIERPKDICGDYVPMNRIISYDLTLTKSQHFLQTHSTNPLLRQETLEKAISDYFNLKPSFDSLFSVNRVQTRLYWESGQPVNHNPAELLRTQDLPFLFEENSNLYLFSKQSFAKAGNNRIGLKPKMFVMNTLESIDIDTEDNFNLAEMIYKIRQQKMEEG